MSLSDTVTNNLLILFIRNCLLFSDLMFSSLLILFYLLLSYVHWYVLCVGAADVLVAAVGVAAADVVRI